MSSDEAQSQMNEDYNMSGLPREQIERILKHLRRGTDDQRVQAERALLDLGSQALDVLLEFLKAESRRRSKRRRGMLVVVCLLVALMIIVTLVGGKFPFAMIGSMTGIAAAAFAATQGEKDAAK